MSLGPGGKLLLVLAGLAIIGLTLHHAGYLRQLDPLLARLRHRPPPPKPLSLADFPPGAAAPSAGLSAMPSRPLKLAVPARAGAASLLWLAGGAGQHPDAPAQRAYALPLELRVGTDADAIRDALTQGPSRGGVDAALISVNELGMRWPGYRDAAPRAVALVARSQGSVALAAAAGTDAPKDLRGKKLALPRAGPGRYFGLFELARAGLGLGDVKLVPVDDSAAAAAALHTSRAEAAVGLVDDLTPAAQARAGKVLATSSDTPFLIDLVLVVRGDLLARYPEAVRRLVRGALDANTAVRTNTLEGARALSAAMNPSGDPVKAIASEPPATLKENLAFFGIEGDAPVHFDELYDSAANLSVRLGQIPSGLNPDEILDTGPLRAVAATPSAPAHR